MTNEFWNFKNISETEGELTIYGDIGDSWFSDSVSARKFDQGLKNLGKVSKINVRINSGGGDVFTGHHIYAALKDHPANVTATIEGLAASAASVIAMSANEIVMHSSDFMMIHNPAASTSGEAKDFTKMADILGTIKEGIINAYAEKTGKDKQVISDLMDSQKWMTGEDAVKEGFADRLATDSNNQNQKPVLNGNILIVNGLSHDLSNLKTRPNIKNESENNKPGSFSFLDKILNIFKDNSQVETLVTNILENNLPKEQQTNNKKEEGSGMEIKNIEDLKKAYPDLINQVETAAVNTAKPGIVEETLKNERARFQDIEKISKNIDPELVNKAKFIEPIDAKSLAFQAMQADNGRGMEYLENLKNDAKSSGSKGVTGTTTDDLSAEEKKNAENIAADNIAAGANKTGVNRRRGK